MHIIIDDAGNLLNVKITPGNINDRKTLNKIRGGIFGLLFGDKRYISRALFLRLISNGVKLVAGIAKNMRNVYMPFHEKIMLRKRSIVETVFDYSKNKMQLEHARHRSPVNAFIQVITTLITYQMKPCKPSISNSFYLGG